MPQEAVKPLLINIRADLKDRLKKIAAERQVSMTKVIEQWLESEPNDKESKPVEKRKKENQAGRKK